MKDNITIITRAAQAGHVKLGDRPTGPPPIHLRGDSILPFVTEGNFTNTDDIRRDKFTLLVIPGKTKTASGDLFWDDGESINTIESGKYNYYTFKLHPNCSLEIDVIKSGYDMSSEPQIISGIGIVGTVDGDIEASIDGKPLDKNSLSHDNHFGTTLKVDLNLQSKKAGDKWIINWKLTKTNSCNIK
jgi:hypothetical protein